MGQQSPPSVSRGIPGDGTRVAPAGKGSCRDQEEIDLEIIDTTSSPKKLLGENMDLDKNATKWVRDADFIPSSHFLEEVLIFVG